MADHINYPKIEQPEYLETIRAKNVLACMLFQFKDQNITLKHERFVLAYRKTMAEFEAASSDGYLPFDQSPKSLDEFIELLCKNLAELKQNFSVAKLGRILAQSLGFSDYKNLKEQLTIYKHLVENPWRFDSKRVIKPRMSMLRNEVTIAVPFQSLYDNSRASGYQEHHECYCKIRKQQKGEDKAYTIYMPFKPLYKDKSFRTFALSEQDAIAWILAACIHEIGVDSWNAHTRARNALNQVPELEDKWVNHKEETLTKLN